MNKKFHMLGRHFAGDCGVSVRTKKDAIPSANVKRKVITLPSNLATGQERVVLAWLMHESSHIRSSQPVEECLDYAFLKPFLNSLEDIRVDREVFQRYPAVKKYLFRRSAEHARSSQDGWQHCKRPARILVAIILKAEGFGDLMPKDEQVKQFFSRHGKQAMRIAEQAARAATTSRLVPLASRLARLIMPDAFKEKGEELQNARRKEKEVKSLEAKKEELDKRRKSLSGKIRYRRKRIQKQPDTEEGREEKQRYQDEIDDLQKKKDSADAERDRLRDRLQRARDGVEEAKEKVNETGEDIAKRAGEVPDIHGVDAEELQYVDRPSLDGQFDRLLADSLREKEVRAAKGRTRILPRNLYATYTRPSKVFGSRRRSPARWKNLGFLLDASGSMRGGKERLVLTVMLSLAEALERVSRSAGTSGQLRYGIWAFDSKARQLKGPDERFRENMLDNYNAGGGTDLGRALKAVGKEMERDGSGSPQSNILFCMTDAQVTDGDVRFARRFRKARVVYLGIGAEESLRGNSKTEEIRKRLFLRHNITGEKELEAVLKEAVLQEL